MKKILFTITLAVLFGFGASAQVRNHESFMMEIEGSYGISTFNLSEKAYKTGFTPNSFSIGMNAFEIYFGKRQQHCIIPVGVRAHLLSGRWEIPLEYSSSEYPAGKYEGRAFNEEIYIGYKYLFRSGFYLEARPGVALCFPLSAKYPDGSKKEPKVGDDSKITWGPNLSLAAGYNMTDSFRVFFIATKCFVDNFNHKIFGSTTVKETGLSFQIGLGIGIM